MDQDIRVIPPSGICEVEEEGLNAVTTEQFSRWYLQVWTDCYEKTFLSLARHVCLQDELVSRMKWNGMKIDFVK